MAGRPKGLPKTGGRQKGTPNKIDGCLRSDVMESFYLVGGVDYLVKQAIENPVPYLSLIGKCLPKDVNTNVTLNKSELLQEIVANLPK